VIGGIFPGLVKPVSRAKVLILVRATKFQSRRVLDEPVVAGTIDRLAA
jgi:hypothetical protein